MSVTCTAIGRARDEMLSTQFSPSQLALLDQPQAELPEPEPHTKLGQQVRRLMQYGRDFYKAADAVSVCRRIGEKRTYECGRDFLHKIILAHRRFCCPWCDRHDAIRRFEEHRIYRERLDPAGTLHQVTVRPSLCALSSDDIRDFEDALVGAVRRWLKGCQVWGLKFLTNYEDGCVVAKCIVYLPPGASLPPNGLQIPSAACRVGTGAPVWAFETMLAEILKPTLTEGHGVLRADLMVAFHRGRHFRSLGVLTGQTSKKREKERVQPTEEKLHLTTAQSGTTSAEVPGPIPTDMPGANTAKPQDLGDANELEPPLSHAAGLSAPFVPPCPHCRRGCKRVSVSREPMSELQNIPSFEQYNLSERTWGEMRALFRRKYVF